MVECCCGTSGAASVVCGTGVAVFRISGASLSLSRSLTHSPTLPPTVTPSLLYTTYLSVVRQYVIGRVRASIHIVLDFKIRPRDHVIVASLPVTPPTLVPTSLLSSPPSSPLASLIALLVSKD